MPDHLDQRRDAERDAEPEAEALERLLLEGLAADVADHRRVGPPRERGDGVEEGELAQLVADGAGGERDRGARAGDVAADDEDRAAAVLDQLAAALEAPLPCGALLGPRQQPPAGGPAEDVGDVVAGERAQRPRRR